MIQKPTLTILNSDCLAALKTLPDNSIHCCVTSPPYYGLRDYKTSKWEGGDPTCDHTNPKSEKPTWGPESTGSSTLVGRPSNDSHEREGFKGKICPRCGAHRIDDQIGLEETPQQYIEKMVEVFREVKRVLREDGVCWLNLGDSFGGTSGVHAGGSDKARSNQGAVNATLPTKGGKAKNLLMIPARVALVLQEDGWYLRSSCPWIKRNAMPESVKDRPSTTIESIFMLTKSPRYFYDTEAVKVLSTKYVKEGPRRKTRVNGNRNDEDKAEGGSQCQVTPTRSRRSSDWFFESWQGMLQDEEGNPVAFVVNTKPYKGAHFACFPPDLIRPMVRAGCPVEGTVLDPFGGSGTTAQVALEHGCNAIVCELNPDYIPLIHQRCDSLLS